MAPTGLGQKPDKTELILRDFLLLTGGLGFVFVMSKHPRFEAIFEAKARKTTQGQGEEALELKAWPWLPSYLASFLAQLSYQFGLRT